MTTTNHQGARTGASGPSQYARLPRRSSRGQDPGERVPRGRRVFGWCLLIVGIALIGLAWG